VFDGCAFTFSVDRVGCMVQVFFTMQTEASLSKCGHLSLIKKIKLFRMGLCECMWEKL